MVPARDPEQRDTALAEALVARGFDVWLDAVDVDDELADRALDLFLRWLTGVRLTERADEPERRVRAAERAREAFGAQVPAMLRYHAQAVLALPPGHEERDEPAAIAALAAHLDAARDAGDADEAVRTIAALLDVETADEALLDEGERWAADADAEGGEAFLLAAESYAAGRQIDARDAGDEAGVAHWAQRHSRYVAADDDDRPGALASRASDLDMDERWDEAADAYHELVAASDLTDPAVQVMAQREGELCLMLGRLDRAAAALEGALPYVEASYLDSVTDADVGDAQRRLDAVARALAATLARLGDWDGVVRACDRAGGLRGRYRAALGADPAGRELLAVERELDAAARGAAGDRAELLERYRQLRPRLGGERLASPSIAELAAPLETDEAVAVLGFHFTGTLAAVVLPGDRDRPAGRLLLEDFDTRAWLELFAGDDSQWLISLTQPGGGAAEPGLSAVLAGVDERLGSRLGALLAEHAVRRLTVVPDGMLHLIPWAALPSLRGVDVAIAASVSDVVRARRPAAGPAARAALVVANPTGDLRVSAAACAPVAERLGAAGFEVTELGEADATEPALLAALPGRTLLHFAGHGQSDALRSGLELHPDAALRGDGDPLGSWAERVPDWRAAPAIVDDDDEVPWRERFAPVPGLGRLTERRWEHVARLDRRLEYAGGTLVATYAGDRLLRLAELWSAADLNLQSGLEDCRVAVLVACSSGAGLGVSDEARAGLPVSLLHAGVGTVIATHWEVEEGLAAVWAESFYEGLAAALPRADLAALVHRVGAELRTLSAERARGRLLALADRAGDPFAAMELEAYAHRLPDPPFAAPSRWAAFYLTGRPVLELR